MTIRPKWFIDGVVVVSNAPTCGINKDGLEQYKVDPLTGERSQSEIDDQLSESVRSILEGHYDVPNVFLRELTEVKESGVYVPQYHDFSTVQRLWEYFESLPEFEIKSIGELMDEGKIIVRGGHGSPSSDQRIGDIPYIKVSDIRAGHINVNSSNMIPLELAKKYWKGESSLLKAYDLISPSRASKNIGEFSVLMPGQERIVLTKEVFVLRSNCDLFDQFYLMWALSLKLVRDQWNRIVLMQTNREDVGDRISEIVIPVPLNKETGDSISQHLRNYYITIESARNELRNALKHQQLENIIHLD